MLYPAPRLVIADGLRGRESYEDQKLFCSGGRDSLWCLFLAVLLVELIILESAKWKRPAVLRAWGCGHDKQSYIQLFLYTCILENGEGAS